MICNHLPYLQPSSTHVAHITRILSDVQVVQSGALYTDAHRRTPIQVQHAVVGYAGRFSALSRQL
jgi:hypothetical protein